MRKLGLVFIIVMFVSLFVASSLFAENTWEYKEDEDMDGMTKTLTSWDKNFITEESMAIQISNIYNFNFVVIISSFKIKDTFLIRFKFDDNPAELFHVNHLSNGNSYVIDRYEIDEFLSKLRKAKRVMVELPTEEHGNVCGKFYTEGLDLSKIGIK